MHLQSPITTVLLDVDGTLLDTREFILQAFEHSIAKHGLAYPGRAHMAAQVGLPLEQIYAAIHAGLEPALVEAHRSFQEENQHLAVAFPGTAEALAQLRDRALQLAAVTSRSRRTSIRSLEVSGLFGLFDAIVSAEDAAALKPDPAPLRHALAVLGADAAGAVMVGDTAADILAGRALGIRTIAATYGFGGRSVLDHAPDAVIEDIAELVAALGF
ncbi:MAG: HAD-IA family hydrolase [Anaerolineaceae bacterium]